MRTFGVVGEKERVEVLLHLFDRFIEGLATLDPEVLIEQHAMQPLDRAVGLRTRTFVVQSSLPSSCSTSSYGCLSG